MSDFKNIAVIAGTSESAVFIEAFQNKYSITAFAATEQLSPTSKEPRIFAPEPTVTLFPSVG